jgi:D-3-phosphoglycerate dehydrogenase
MQFCVIKATDVISLGDRQIGALEDAGAQLLERPCRTENDLIEHARNADALLIVNEPLTRRVITSLSRCRVIGRFGVGVDTIDLDAATAAGIQVTNVPGASAEEVSDHALAMLMAWSRRLIPLDADVHAGNWSYLAAGPAVRRLRTQVLGIIGAGRIGSLFARKASCLGLKVLAYDPYVDEKRIAAIPATPVPLSELLAESDYVSLHIPLGPETRNLIAGRELVAMKPSAYLINVSRGELIDEPALVEALERGTIAGASLDVLVHEPPARDDPLLRLSNVLLTPHAAHYSEDSLEEVRQTAVEDVIRVLRGEPPLHPVNRVPA